MKQHLDIDNFTDRDGNPNGGTVEGRGLQIVWQQGPLVRDGERRDPNGCFVETVIEAALSRMEYYQTTKFNCRENALAITKLQEALHWLNHRTAARESRGVEGSHAT